MASEIRVNQIQNRSGLSTVTFSDTGVVISGITTISDLRTSGGALTVGTGASISSPATNVLALGTNNTEAVRIDSSGNLGVGNTNPGAKLDVAGDVRLSAANAEIEFNSGGARLKARTNALSIHTGSGLDSDASEQVRINTTGVGIGTTNPQRSLHIYGNYSELVIEDPLNSANSNKLNIYLSSDKAQFRMLNQAGTGGTVFLQGDSSGNVTLPTAGSSILNSSGRKILNQTGSILQVVSVNKTDEYFLSGTGTPTDVPGLSVSITPSSTSSQILILGHVNYSATSGGGDSFARLMRGATAIGSGAGGYFGQIAGQDYFAVNPNVIFLVDSPATTSSTTYKIQVWGQSLYVNSRGIDASFDTSSQIVLMEIAG